jgi:hypothetical protein
VEITMRCIFSCLIALLCMWVSAAAVDLPRILPGRGLVLPPQIQEMFNDTLKDFRVPTINDYRVHGRGDSAYLVSQGRDPNLMDAWDTSPDSTLPYLCLGDFNGDSLLDAAMLLLAKKPVPVQPRPKNPPVPFPPRSAPTRPERLSCTLFIFEQTRSGYRLVAPLGKWPDFWGDVLLVPRAPGTIRPFPFTEADLVPVSIPYTGIDWINSESSACVVYWDGTAYKQVWYSD